MLGHILGHILSVLTVLGIFTKSSLASLPSGVLFPLYIYPQDGCTAWSAVTSIIPQNGDLIQFYVVVNPDSGPEGSPGSQPDADYQACIISLREAGAQHGNLILVGYVKTGYGTRSSSDVTSEIDTYSQWSPAYRPDGIFFDEVSDSAALLPTYQSYTERVHQDFGTSFVSNSNVLATEGLDIYVPSKIVLNPGATPLTSGYFNIADLVVTFEGFYNDYSSSSLTIAADRPAKKQVVILHDGPAQLSFQIVKQLSATTGIGASFITSYPQAVAYENIPSYWCEFIAFVIASQSA